MDKRSVNFKNNLTPGGEWIKEHDPERFARAEEAMAKYFQRQREEAKRLGMTLKAYRKKLAAEAEARANQ